MAKVTLKGVEKQYPNGFKAVHGINLDIKDGEFMVFVGPSDVLNQLHLEW